MNSDSYEYEHGETPFTEWSMARRPKEGEKICGDLYLIKKTGDEVLVGVIDGLGHGSDAAEASRRAVHVLETFNNNESIITLIKRCHNHLRGTRGVVMSLAIINTREHTLTWIGIGNVDGLLFRGKTRKETPPAGNIILRGGVVGYELPHLQASIFPISSGDMLIFVTDGVNDNFVNTIDTSSATHSIVDYTARNYFKKTDDALILALRFLDE